MKKVTTLMQTMIAVSLASSFSFAQETKTLSEKPAIPPITRPLPQKEQKKEDDILVAPQGIKFLYLTVGSQHDEKYAGLPGKLKTKGDYRKFFTFQQIHDKKIFRIMPREEGISTITLHGAKGEKLAEYRVVIKKNRLDTVARELQSLLGDIEGITIKIANNKIIVDGMVILPKDWSRIQNVISEYKDETGKPLAANLVTMSPVAMKKIAEYIAREINNPEVEVRVVNEKIILSGQVNSQQEKDQAKIIAMSYMPPLVVDPTEAEKKVLKPVPTNQGVIDLLQIKQQPQPPPPRMIQVVFHYVELSKNYSNSFKFQFTPGMNDGSGIQIKAGDGGSGFVTEFTATIYNLLPKLNWLKAHGHARVLESSSLLIKDGDTKKSVLNSSTTIPGQSTLSGGVAQTANPVKFGVFTQVQGVINGEKSDSIDLELIFNVSAPVGPLIGSQTQTAENVIDTKVTVRNNQSAAIGGVIKNTANTDYNRLPDGARDPVIALLASKAFTRSQSQFVIFVTPTIKSSASAGAEKVKKKFRLRD